MFKPMLAPGQSPISFPDYFKLLKFPLLASPKLDGIRCIIKDGIAMSRTFKPLPSIQVQEMFGMLEHMDGELIEGNVTDYNVYNRTQSYVMSEDKPGNMYYYVFDYTHPDMLSLSFDFRLNAAYKTILDMSALKTYHVHHSYIQDIEQLLDYENKQLSLGYEGIMMRDPKGRYKNGRGTFKEGLIYKLKRFEDAEGIILEVIEATKNTNQQEKDELGYAKRSEAKEGLVKSGMVGKFVVDFNNDEIEVAPGNFNHEDRIRIWNNCEAVIGRTLKFRYFSHGIKDKPRFPRAVGFRSESDI